MPEDDEIIISRPKSGRDDADKLPPTPNLENEPDKEEVPLDPPRSSPPGPENDTPNPEKDPPKKKRKIAKMADFQKFSEESFLDNADDLIGKLYTSLGQILVDLPGHENPNPKFIDLAAQLLGLIKTPTGISITNNTINNSGNTTLLHASGGSFEQIADRYHRREKEGYGDEFKSLYIDKAPDPIDATIIEAEKIEIDVDDK